MEKRKQCLTCKEYLIAFQGHFLHVEKPCTGIPDCINIEATIVDEVLHEKFLELYGKPSINDHERLEEYEKQLNSPIVKVVLKILSYF